MEKRMGTLTDDKDGKVSPDPLHSPVRDTETLDEHRIPDTETPYGKCPTRCTADKNSYTVKGSENSTIRDSTVIGVLNKTVITNEKQQEGVTCNVTAEGAKPRVKISVPAEDGGTVIHVECINGKLEQWLYSRKVDTENTFGSRWTFGNIPDGFMVVIINEEKSDEFFDLIEKLEERYGCKVYKVYKKCLVIEFRHETEEGRDRMIKEEETVRKMFQTFIDGINPNAPSCTLKVSTDTDKPDTELKHIEQDVSVPSTSKSEKAQAQGMLPPEYKKEERFQSVSDDESERQLKEKMKYSDESGELAEFPISIERKIKEKKRERRWASEPHIPSLGVSPARAGRWASEPHIPSLGVSPARAGRWASEPQKLHEELYLSDHVVSEPAYFDLSDHVVSEPAYFGFPGIASRSFLSGTVMGQRFRALERHIALRPFMSDEEETSSSFKDPSRRSHFRARPLASERPTRSRGKYGMTKRNRIHGD
ncbi:uncharacterized protein LOC124131262 isoform X2 [Haliotis rufescens]|uniref:uncharacterized protein LOC124131262 isoform X2 n=1 Tax=Haliotis rufescens TaxID=6454 RepID=UPI00201F2252|nr:uncharacterized protein LOC124131262 isoform X2 [Haliotis rufescens]